MAYALPKMHMFYPRWLPPLNDHHDYTLRISAHQTPLSSSSPPPYLLDYISINVHIGAVFFAELGRTLPGLALSKFCHIHPSHIRTSNLISQFQIPFPLDNTIKWESKAIHGAWSTRSIEGEDMLEDTLKDFLCGSVIVPGSVVAVRVEKMVQVPPTEFGEWCRWYDHNAMACEGFESQYAMAIRRPRTELELLEELVIGFRSLPSMTMREFLEKEWEKEWDIEEEEEEEEEEDDDGVMLKKSI